MSIIRVNGIDLPGPTKYNVSLQDIDSSNTGRTETGILIRDRIRQGVYKITVTWLVKHSQLRIITDAISPAKFLVSFFDPTTGTTPTRDMYCGDRNGELKHYDVNNPPNSLWEISTSLIEY